MPRFRRRLSWALAGWLVCQLVGITAPLLVTAATAVEQMCACPDAEEGAACPMHQAQKSAPAGQRTLKNACQPTDVALLSMSSGAGILEQPFVMTAGEALGQPVSVSLDSATSIVVLLESPPPRA